MGYMRHHAIVVTGFTEDVDVAHEKATDMRLFPSAITRRAVNGFRSFLVPPDGSKEGWTESEAGDAAREEFVSWLKSTEYDDGSSVLSWAEIQFGDDNQDNRMLRSSR